MSKVFDHPLDDEALKIHLLFASQHYSYSELLFLIAQSVPFNSKINISIIQTNSQSVFYAQVTSSVKAYEIISEIERVNAQSTGFQKTFDLFKQIEDIIEPYRANISELSDSEILEKVRHGYHIAIFSCANLRLSLIIMQHSSNEIQTAVTFLKEVFSINLPSKI